MILDMLVMSPMIRFINYHLPVNSRCYTFFDNECRDITQIMTDASGRRFDLRYNVLCEFLNFII